MEPKPLRVHLVQIDYRPAYFQQPVDFLEEPFGVTSAPTAALGTLRSRIEVGELLCRSRSAYLSNTTTKICEIVNYSAGRGGNLIVFPEYSIPVELLPSLKKLSDALNVVIVAGSHRVTYDDRTRPLYSEAGIDPLPTLLGASISPVFVPHNPSQVFPKLTRSKWEPNLNIPPIKPKVCSFEIENHTVSIAVLPCVDSLNVSVLGEVMNGPTVPQLVICPSLSPSTSEFSSSGCLLALQSALFVYCNHTAHGGSFFHIPPKLSPYIDSVPALAGNLLAGSEAILELRIVPKTFFLKSGSIDPGLRWSGPYPIPIISESEMADIADFKQYREETLAALRDGRTSEAAEWLDMISTDSSITNPCLLNNVKTLRHSFIPFYDGDADKFDSLLSVCWLDSRVLPAKALASEVVAEGLQICTHAIIESRDPGESTNIFRVIEALKALRERLPSVVAPNERIPPRDATSQRRQTMGVLVETDLDRRFQDRGRLLDEFRDIFTNPEIRIVFVVGPLGIGKSALCEIIFRKQFADWTTQHIKIAQGTKVPRLISELGFALGLPIDIDALATANQKVFRFRIRQILERLFSTPKRAIIVDDLHALLTSATTRDINQFKIFCEEAQAVKFSGGKLLFVSSRFLPRAWMAGGSVRVVNVRRLGDTFISRMVEYDLRASNIIEGEFAPTLPQEILDVIGGNPLVARLAVQAEGGRVLQRFFQTHRIEENSNLTRIVAEFLLHRIGITETEKRTLQQIAIFRLPIRLDLLKQVTDNPELIRELSNLAERAVLGYDGSVIEMHEVIRRFFLQGEKGNRAQHNIAMQYYYGALLDSQQNNKPQDPSVMGEFAYHIAMAGLEENSDVVNMLIAEELKPAARYLYRVYKDYPRARHIYHIITEIRPTDLDAWASVGRCFGREQKWTDCEVCFLRAIELAGVLNQNPAWIYRDWGHILSRYQRYEAAMRLLDRAATLEANDPATMSAQAYILWKAGDVVTAEELFEGSLEINRNQGYTLRYYSEFLREQGRLDYARTLEKRLAELEQGALEEIYVEDDFDDHDE